MQKTSVIAGALTLTASGIAVRILGFFYRIYMVNAIGDEGMGLFQLIMPVYMLMWSITASGFTTTISKMTSQENARQTWGNIRVIMRKSLEMCLVISIISALILFLLSGFLSVNILKDARTEIPLKALAFAIPFMSAGSCIRGCFFGMQESRIPAISQIIEQIVRLSALFVFAPILVEKGLTYAALCAVIGIVAGETISFIYVFFYYIKFSKKHFSFSKVTRKPSKISSEIRKMAFPLTLTRITASSLAAAENILIPQRLSLYSGETDPLASYGRLTGMAMPLIQLPSSFLTALAISLVPAVSKAKAIQKNISKTISKALVFTIIIGIGASALFAVFPKEICVVIYNQRDLGALVMKLAFCAPFIYLQITLSGILNGLGNQLFLFKLSVISSVINVFFIYFLVPQFGVNAFIAGVLVSLCICSGLSLGKLNSQTQLKFSLPKNIAKPLLCAAASSLVTKCVQNIIPASRFAFFGLIIFLIISYFGFLMALGVFSFKDIKFIFFSQKKNPVSSADI